MTALNTASETEAWLESIGTPFTNVWLCVKGQLIDERHVKDDTTIQTTAKMSAERLRAKTCAYAIDGEWEVMRLRDLTFRRCPTEEAAKMVALFLV